MMSEDFLRWLNHTKACTEGLEQGRSCACGLDDAIHRDMEDRRPNTIRGEGNRGICEVCGQIGGLTHDDYWIHLDRYTEVQHPFVVRSAQGEH